MGSPLTMGASTTPVSVAIDSDGQFLYVVSYTTNELYTFSIDPSTGGLTAVGSPVSTGSAPNAVITLHD